MSFKFPTRQVQKFNCQSWDSNFHNLNKKKINVGPPKEDIFSGHLRSPIFQSSLHVTITFPALEAAQVLCLSHVSESSCRSFVNKFVVFNIVIVFVWSQYDGANIEQ